MRFTQALPAIIALSQIGEAYASNWLSADSWRSLKKRATNGSGNNTIPAAISIAPSQYWDGNDGPWSSFPLQLGTGSTIQNIRAFISTAAYNTWSIGADKGCPAGYVDDCANKRGFLFYPNKSLTWLPNSNFESGIELNLGLDTNGPQGWDTVALGWQGSGGPVMQHSVLLTIYDPRFWLGLFGLNPLPSNYTNLNNPQPSFMQTLYDNGSIPSRSYGYTAGNQYRGNKVFGSLTLGGYDQNRFKSEGALSFTMFADISRDLLVAIDSITTNTTATGGGQQALLPDGRISSFIDSTIPEIYLPESACKAFESAFNLTYNQNAGVYLVDAATHASLKTYNPTITFSLNNGNASTQIALPYAAFDLNVSFPIVNTSSYYFPLQRADNDTQYTLGRTFLQEAYLISDYDHSNFTVAPCAWDNTATSSVKNILSPSLQAIVDKNSGVGHSGLTGGAIAGIVIGVLVGLALIGALVFFFLRRKRQETAARNAVYEKDGDPLTAKQEAAKTAPVTADVVEDPHNELHGSHLMELEAMHRDKPHEMDTAFKYDHYGHRPVVEMDNSDDFGRHRHEMEAEQAPLFEMPGSDVHEIYSSSPPEKKGGVFAGKR